jgi:Spy/CpxP family protein refolding chaperone
MEHETSRRHRINLPRRASRRHKILVTLTTLALAGAIGWGVATAADDDGIGLACEHHQGWGPHERGPGDRVKAMTRKLDLNATQQAQIQEILEASHEKTKALRAQMHGMRSELHQMISSGAYSEEQARIAAERLSPVFVEMTVLMSRTMNDVRAVLTPEQRARANEFFEQRREGRAGRHRLDKPAAPRESS